MKKKSILIFLILLSLQAKTQSVKFYIDSKTCLTCFQAGNYLDLFSDSFEKVIYLPHYANNYSLQQFKELTLKSKITLKFFDLDSLLNHFSIDQVRKGIFYVSSEVNDSSLFFTTSELNNNFWLIDYLNINLKKKSFLELKTISGLGKIHYNPRKKELLYSHPNIRPHGSIWRFDSLSKSDTINLDKDFYESFYNNSFGDTFGYYKYEQVKNYVTTQSNLPFIQTFDILKYDNGDETTYHLVGTCYIIPYAKDSLRRKFMPFYFTAEIGNHSISNSHSQGGSKAYYPLFLNSEKKVNAILIPSNKTDSNNFNKGYIGDVFFDNRPFDQEKLILAKKTRKWFKLPLLSLQYWSVKDSLAYNNGVLFDYTVNNGTKIIFKPKNTNVNLIQKIDHGYLIISSDKNYESSIELFLPNLNKSIVIYQFNYQKMNSRFCFNDNVLYALDHNNDLIYFEIK